MRQQLRNLLRTAWPHRRYYLAGVVTLLVVNACDVALPWIIKIAIDDIARYDGLIPLVWIAGGYLGIAGLLAYFRYWWRVFFLGTSHRIAAQTRSDLFGHLQRQAFSFFDRQRTGDLMSRATNDLEAVRNLYGIGLLLTFDTLFYFLLIPPLMFLLSPELCLYTLLPLPLVPLFVYKLGAVIHKRFRQVQEKMSDLSNAVQESAAGVRVVKAFAREDATFHRFNKLSAEYVEQNLDLARVQSVFHPALGLVMQIGLFVVILVGGLQVMDGVITVGTFVAFATYLRKLIWPMTALGWVVGVFQRGLASFGRIRELLEREPDIQDTAAVRTDLDHIGGSIRFQHLSFTYPQASYPALQDVDFEVNEGETVAILGTVGSGKTTLLQLVARLYDPPPGTVFVGGYDVRELPLQRLRRHIGAVPQQTFLFSTSIQENIAFGLNGEATTERVARAAGTAQIADFIESLPQQYETLLGERGVNLSGGQKQRVAIARALVLEPAILLLDDCLSSVDARTEEAILNDREGALQRRTSLIVSHRVAACRAADRIIVMEEGRIIEQGTHEELLSKAGHYRRTYERQVLEEELEAA